MADRGRGGGTDSGCSAALHRKRGIHVDKGSEHLLSRLGLAFQVAAVEQDYRAWRVRRILPLIRIAIVASMMSWIIVAALLRVWQPDAFAAAFPYVAAVVLPAFAIGALLCSGAKATRWAIPTATCLQIIGGLGAGLVIARVGGSPGGALSWVILVALFAPLMQLPPGIAAIAVSPYLLLLSALNMRAYFAGTVSRIDAFSYLFSPVMTLSVVVAVCVLMERVARRAYIDDRTIVRQKSLLERSRDLIRRYVPPQVAERIEAGDELSVDTPTRRRVTVLFCDIVGFTDVADRVDAESLTQVINEYMVAMSACVGRHGGTLNEFAGDGLMALFGAPAAMPVEQQAENAAQTAFEMQARMPALNEGWLKLGIGQPIQIRIGINTGVLSVGSFGSEGRMSYTAIGLQANIAGRIQTHCAPGGILISENTWHLLKDRIPCESRGSLLLKGLHFPIEVHEPLPSGP